MIRFARLFFLFSGLALLGCGGVSDHRTVPLTEGLKQEIDSLNTMAWAERRNNPQFADSLAVSLLARSRETGYGAAEAYALKVIAGTRWIQGRHSEALLFADTSFQLFQSIGDSTQAGNLLNQKGLIVWNLGDYDQAKGYYLQAKLIFESTGDEDGVNKVYNNLGILSYQRGAYAEALEYYMKALEYNERTGQAAALADVCDNIGIVYGVLNDHDRELEFKRRALSISIEAGDKRRILISHSNLGTSFFNMDKLDSAEHYLRSALAYAREMGDVYTEAHVLNNLGEMYINQSKYALAKESLEACKALREEIGDKLGLAIVLRNLGLVSNYYGDIKNSQILFEKSLALAEEIGSREQAMNTSDELVSLFEYKGNFESANDYLRLYYNMRDSLFNEDQSAIIQDLTIKYETEKKEKELLLKKAELEQARSNEMLANQRLLALGALGLLLLVIAWLSITRQRKTFQASLALEQSNKALLDIRLKNETLEKARLQEELHYKNKEITNFALMLVQKRELVEKITDRLIAFKSQKDPGSGFEQLIKDIRQMLMVDKETEEFEAYVDQVCGGFFISLDKSYPNLTANEKRLAALLRLNLSSKEIAGVLNISPKSVDMNRYRLRKKLNIDSEEELTDLFARI